ncbi:MAG: amino acid adenylation domain-containing protein [Dysgonamonadaceae bacterium]|jgi:amino acid adenylation domain-containing protein|nr:amino acid adenylation domain-containing protein [Dysgonamonadaceae bacterium]
MQINVTEYLDRTVQLFPQKIAVDDIHKSLTFSQIQKQARALAGLIIEQGLQNAPVAVCMQKGCDMVACFAAISYSGNFYVPIDMKSPDSRIKNIFDSLRSKVIITNKANDDRLKSFFDGKIILIENVENIEPDASVEKLIHSRQERVIDTDPVYSIFTSGSTGNPKGVVISHRGVIDYMDWAISTFSVNEKAVIANQAPFYFDNSTLDLYLMFGAGATLVIVPEEYYAFPAKLIDLLNEKKINFVFWVPFVLINVANYNLLEQKKPEYLEKILFAGEVMPNKHLNYWRKNLPDCLYANLYGPTEITVDCTCYIVDREFSDEEPLPVGKPCRNSGILILTEDNRAAKVNETGELCVRGSSLAMGYYNDPERTAKSFVQNPLNIHYPELIYRTGDMAYWNERGEVMYVGRRDFQIKHNGYRIELGEIENAVLGTKSVDTACVIYNHTRKEIEMFYQAADELNAGEFRKRMMEFVPKYMVPTKYYRLEKFPLSANGKIDRLKLAEQISG